MDTEVIIIGGGPAGSSAATMLARSGMRVRVIEKEAFPRFHIGESLLPKGNRLLCELGLLEKVQRAGFLEKRAAEFITPDRSHEVVNVFAEGSVRGLDSAFEVERARFDTLLLEHAREAGAQVDQPARVESVEETSEGWEVHVAGAETLACRWLIDASGRGGVLGRQRGLKKEALPYPKRAAVFTHFGGVPLQGGGRAGNIVITRLASGWFWFIPLGPEKTSAGLVCSLERLRAHAGTPEELFLEEVAHCPWLSEQMKEARPLEPFRVEADYSYSYASFAGERYLLAGDAACFIDPIFSSGVCLALESGISAAKVLLGARGKPVLPAKVREQYTRTLHKRVRRMRDLIDMFYDPDGFAVFMSPTNPLRVHQAVNSIVAGETSPPWHVRGRLALVRLIYRLNRKYHFIPRVTGPTPRGAGRGGRPRAGARPSTDAHQSA